MQQIHSLIRKYDIPTPRYTSYPTVPYWEESSLDAALWKENIRANWQRNPEQGISLYIHLPFCESLCTYCGCNKRITVNHQVEMPYIESLLKEWRQYVEILGGTPVISELHLGGGTPTFFSAENLEYLLGNLLEHAVIAEDAEMSVEVHPNVTTYTQLESLYKIGFRRLSVGIQDFDPQVQFVINRFQTFEQTAKVFQWARELGYESINADMIYGLPKQSQESIRMTVEKIKELMPERIAFYSYAHVPWKSPAQRRYTEADLPFAEEKRNLYELGRVLLLDKGYKDIGMDHFALSQDNLYKASQEGRMHRNFMGYTTRHTELLIGLGASSISETPDAFMQNEKEVEAYQRQIAEAGMAFGKGHLLNQEDKILRKHILNLMCKGETSWCNTAEQIPYLKNIISKLIPLDEDGLIEIRRKGLKVKPLGKAFLRNIALQFDARYWGRCNMDEKPVFSKAI